MRSNGTRWASRAFRSSLNHCSSSSRNSDKPVSAAQRRQYAKQRTSTEDRARRDIASQELCDNILQILKPSLPSPGTCDIIDVNPGAGLWSRSLNQAVQPRTHLLVEREATRYQDTLKELLEHEGSRYRHILQFSDIERSPDLLSTQRELQMPSKFAKKKVNPSLLMTANLSLRSLNISGFTGAFCKFFLDQYRRAIMYDLGAISTGQLGIPKLLAWVPDNLKQSFLPQTAGYRFKSSLFLEATCDIREIAGGPLIISQDTKHSPSYHVARISAARVEARDELVQMQLPLRRRQPPPDLVHANLDPYVASIEDYKALAHAPLLVKQYIDLYEKVKKHSPEQFSRFDSGPQKRGKKPVKQEPDSADLFKLISYRRRLTAAFNNRNKSDNLADTLWQTEQALITSSKRDPPQKYERNVKNYLSKAENFQLQLMTSFKDTKVATLKCLDDLRTLLTDPPALPWNARPFEPLRVYNTDFEAGHEKNLSLLEFAPKQSFLDHFDTYSKMLCLEHTVTTLDAPRSKSVVHNLISLLQVSSDSPQFEDFLASVPSLCDVSRGALPDLNQVRVRTLPIQTFIDIALAYNAWPYRKTDEELISLTFDMRQISGKQRE